jgi:ribosomal protein L37AE/L43A
MPSMIERATSGRAKCRVCGQAIVKGEARFGEALPSAYGEGESLCWFHLPCAACARPESFLPVLAQASEALPDRAELEALAQSGLAQPRLCRILRAERASSGRAKCRHCREVIAQGAWRLCLQIFEEVRFNPIGTIHATCAVGYFGVEPPLSRLKLPGNELGEKELSEVLRQMRDGAAQSLASPGLAKAPASDAEAESTRKTS